MKWAFDRWKRVPALGLSGMFVAASGAILLSRNAVPVLAEEPKAAAVKVSVLAPADDLIEQVHYFIQRLDESLADRADFDDARQSRVTKEADVVAVLALGLSLDESKHPLHDSAPRLLASAQSLAAAGADYAAASKSLAAIKAAAAGKGSSAAAPVAPTNWKSVAPLGLLMKEVPIVQASLKRNTQDEQFKSHATQSAGAAATLAVIAQEIMADDTAVKEPAQRPKWQAECAEMRDAAGAVNHAIHAADRDATKASLTRLTRSCAACHADFRKPR